ncbi:TPA: NUDIX hydrolase [Photobacterium damselae]
MTLQHIDKLAWILIQDRKLLAVRSFGKTSFYLPGGKRENGESDQEALIREIQEELAVDLKPDSIEYAGFYQAQADGKPEGVMVKMTCYFAQFGGQITPSAEIEEAQWLNSENLDVCSLAAKIIVEDFKQQGLID